MPVRLTTGAVASAFAATTIAFSCLIASQAAAPSAAAHGYDRGKRHDHRDDRRNDHRNDHRGHDRATLVKTQSGYLRGFANGKVLTFLGIPYAKPPVGQLRWTNPQPPTSWKGERKAIQFGHACMQSPSANFSSTFSEDCLFLNVYAPKDARKRPVMVFIHGGGLTSGTGNIYDGTALAREQNVLVVTINYRLSAFGFFVHPALDAGGANANFGLRDMQFALQWVKNNISNFGGDPKNVTAFGESGGGRGVMLLLASPTAKGLFHKAIIQSGGFGYFNPLPTLAQEEARGQTFAPRWGCTDQTAACLRGVPASTILAANSGANFINDGRVLKMSLRQAFETGQFHRVPIINGSNHDEWRPFQIQTQTGTGVIMTAAEYSTQLAALYGANAAAVEQKYPLSAYTSPDEAFAAVRTDDWYVCAARTLSLQASRYVPVYAYEFNDPNAPHTLPPARFAPLAGHTFELQYLFHGFHYFPRSVEPAPFTLSQKLLSKAMMLQWAVFARHGEPLDWPRYTAKREKMVLLAPPVPRPLKHDFAADHHCGFWDSIRPPL